MFKFDFQNQDTVQEDLKTDHVCEEVHYDLDCLQNTEYTCEQINIGKLSIPLVKSECALNAIKYDEQKDDSVLQADSNHSDLTAGSYEGGLKVWECTYDLGYFLGKSDCVKGKSVLDLGCGSGLLGSLCYKLGAANVDFQDFNLGVIKHFTIPNILHCGESYLKASRFWYGDWRRFIDVNKNSYDIILSSETIYNVDNHKCLHFVFEKKIKQNGIILLAGKSYYFGVGGSIKQFQNLTESLNVFSCRNVWSSNEGVKRDILELKFK